MGILNTFVPLQKSYIYIILIFCNNILFLILIRNAFPAPLRFFVGTTFWKNFLEGRTDRNASAVFVLFF